MEASRSRSYHEGLYMVVLKGCGRGALGGSQEALRTDLVWSSGSVNQRVRSTSKRGTAGRELSTQKQRMIK
eukprot:scaffold193889_cov30-Tisochrysis_lutea.AAC.1